MEFSKKAIAKIKEAFESNPAAELFYATVDGQCFGDTNAAMAHEKELVFHAEKPADKAAMYGMQKCLRADYVSEKKSGKEPVMIDYTVTAEDVKDEKFIASFPEAKEGDVVQIEKPKK